jgi:hypothetical protein
MSRRPSRGKRTASILIPSFWSLPRSSVPRCVSSNRNTMKRYDAVGPCEVACGVDVAGRLPPSLSLSARPRFSTVKDLEVFFPQVEHRVVLRVANHHGHQHLVHFDFDLEGGGVRLFGLLRYRLCAQEECQVTQKQIQKRFPVHTHTDRAILHRWPLTRDLANGATETAHPGCKFPACSYLASGGASHRG